MFRHSACAGERERRRTKWKAIVFVHTVYFWLKPEAATGACEALLRDCRDLLGRIPGLLAFDAGRPAQTPRDVVDNTYSVGLLTAFADRQAHDAYQTHPLHLKFIEKHKASWQRVQVYDFQ